MINYGIVGIGGFASTYVRSLLMLEGQGVARLAAAVVRNPGKYAAQLETLRARGCRIYATVDDMLAEGWGRLDIIGVPTGIAYHEPLGVQAMDAGYNVLIEKPVAGTLPEVVRLRDAERRNGRWCAVGYQFIYSPTTAWLKERIMTGRLGVIREARSMIGWPRPASYYARNAWAAQLRDNDRWILDGPATNATAHYLTNMLYLAAEQMGVPVAIWSVRAELYRSKEIPSYDTSCIEVTMTNGTRLLHYASHALAEALEPTTTLICERGTVEWGFAQDTATIRYVDGTTESFANPGAGHIHTSPFEQLSRVAAGQEPAPRCGLAEGAPHVLVIDLAFESSQEVRHIGTEHIARMQGRDGTELITVTGMEAALKRAQATGAMFSEMGLPWAVGTAPVSVSGYTDFPQGSALRKWLGLAS